MMIVLNFYTFTRKCIQLDMNSWCLKFKIKINRSALWN